MSPLEALIDDYLRTIVRTRPWTKRREEEALSLFARWTADQSGGEEALLADPATSAERCAAELDLHGPPEEHLPEALRNLGAFARAEGPR